MTQFFRPALLAGIAVALLGSVGAAGAQTAPAKPAAKAALAAPKAAVRSAGKRKPKRAAAAAAVLPAASPEQIAAAESVFYGVYDCEFNQTIQIVASPKHAAYVDLKHGKSDYLMKPVLSSTGAIRLEDVSGETLMVQISSKSMLLNVKTARRIVDECVSPKQRELIETVRANKAAEAVAAAASAASAADASTAATAASVASSPASAPADIAASAPAGSAAKP